MDVSVFLAQVMGLGFLLIGLGHLLNLGGMKKLLTEYSKSPALMYLTGFMLTVAGVVLVLHHNTWGADWTLLITILCWLVLVKGLFFVFLPNLMAKEMKSMAKQENLLMFGAILSLVMGVYLGYLGFIVY